MFKTTKILISGFLLATILISCAKDEIPEENNTVFRAELKGSNAVIPNASSANGTAVLIYNKKTKRFTASTSYNGLTPSSAHIHMAPKQKSGKVIFPFDINNASPVIQEKRLLEKQEVDKISRKKLLFISAMDDAYIPSPIIYHSAVLTEQEIEALFEGKLYVDFHTNTFPNGEIRGQLEKQ